MKRHAKKNRHRRYGTQKGAGYFLIIGLVAFGTIAIIMLYGSQVYELFTVAAGRSTGHYQSQLLQSQGD